MIKEAEKIITWIKDYVKNTKAKGVVLGMSGGKDSLVSAALCTRALSKDKVLGIIMPNGEMADITDALDTCKYLGIDYEIIDISTAYKNIIEETQFTLQGRNTSVSSITTTLQSDCRRDRAVLGRVLFCAKPIRNLFLYHN